MQFKLLLSLLLLFSFSPSFAFAQEQHLPKQIESECTKNVGNGCIDWQKGIIYAVGMGVPNTKFKSKAQQRFSAYEAARLVAMRNLLRIVEETHITSKQTVKAGMLEKDEIQQEIQGKIKQVLEVGKPKQMVDGSVWVTVKMYMQDIRNILISNANIPVSSNASSSSSSNGGFITEESEKNMSQSQAAGGESVHVDSSKKHKLNQAKEIDTTKVYTGLIIDLSDQSLIPAMSPKITSQKGVEIYGSSNIGKDFALKYGIVSYAHSLKEALVNERIGNTPLLIKGEVSPTSQSNIILDNDIAHKIIILSHKLSFLREARVTIIL